MSPEHSTGFAFANETFFFQNSSDLNMSNQSAIAKYEIQQLDFWSYFLYMTAVFLMFFSMFVNWLVLAALRDKSTESLHCRFLIQGTIAADIFVSLTIGARVLPYILLAFGCDPILSLVCFESFSLFVRLMSLHVQLCTGLAVAIDRLVSIFRPLKYHTSAYSKVQKVAILGGIWVVMIILNIGVSTIDLIHLPEKPVRHICYRVSELTTRGMFAAYIGPNMALLGIFATVSLYIVLFVFIVKQKTRRSRLSDLPSNLKKSNASLALTFVVVYLTYLMCYLPGIIQHMFFTQDLIEGKLPGYDVTAYSITATIYQLNTIIDPIIFTWRIRSIRNYIWSLFGYGNLIGTKIPPLSDGKHVAKTGQHKSVDDRNDPSLVK